MPITTRNNQKFKRDGERRPEQRGRGQKQRAKSKGNRTRSKKHKTLETETETGEVLDKTESILIKKVQLLPPASTVKKRKLQQKPIFIQLKRRLPILSKQHAPIYFLDTLNYLIEKQGKSPLFAASKIQQWRCLCKPTRVATETIRKYQAPRQEQKRLADADVEIGWEDKFTRFAIVVDTALDFLYEASMKNSAFSCCYFLFMVIVSDAEALENLALRNADNLRIYIYLMVCIFVSTKYNEIYPVQLEDIIQNIDEGVEPREVFECEMMVLSMNNFTEYYVDNESSFLNYFAIIFSWSPDILNFGLFVLESGLNSPLLYYERPSFKAAAVVSMVESLKYKSREQREFAREITGMAQEKEKQLLKLYADALRFNHQNRIYTQRKKYRIIHQFLEELNAEVEG